MATKARKAKQAANKEASSKKAKKGAKKGKKKQHHNYLRGDSNGW